MSRSNLAVQRQLLNYLADGSFYSGQWLADTIGLSRTAIARYIVQLQEAGLDVFKVKGRGYRLAKPIFLLDGAEIRSYQATAAEPVLVQHITDSTNTQLLNRIAEGQALHNGFTLVAEAQTAGRGRRGRKWYSPYGANLYFSMYWRLEQGIQAAMGLSLVVGIALVRLLRNDYQLAAKVKWPNDVYINNKKVAGILVELAGQAHAGCDVIIGIGLNIQMPEAGRDNIDQQWTDLSSETDTAINRNKLIARLQEQLILLLTEFTRKGFSPFTEEFNQINQYGGQLVNLCGTQNVSGVFTGVDNQGGIILDTKTGRQTFYGGELSLRPGAENVSTD
ncbi:bifunctional biotin--[acetyl-CoA-carboxylase] ligase/biotin operon repressor BirA [Chromatiaceae bacterium AAb-1]|nr:bifunctional biotin--[acetyl-CoA-carboxylase] ligase/biotin operon repressor BirA [Chromatiaceae bacterium AAb-1]